MKTLQWLTSALLASAMAMPCAMAQGMPAGGGAANLPSQRIINEAPGGTGASLTLSPATVRRVQQQLNRLGYNTGPVSGSWNRTTSIALADFQRAPGLSPVGRLDEASLRALGVGIGGGYGMAGAYDRAGGSGAGIGAGYGAAGEGADLSGGGISGAGGGLSGGYGSAGYGAERGYGVEGAGSYGTGFGGGNASGNAAGTNGAYGNRAEMNANPNVPGTGISAGNISGINGTGATGSGAYGGGTGVNSGVPPMRGS